eukprot:scpid857/ scgid8744/ Dynein heavy chain 5, axonemal; Axonemal beta dynein heavy chain 5; Ciliary dynein heavy chain 5
MSDPKAGGAGGIRPTTRKHARRSGADGGMIKQRKSHVFVGGAADAQKQAQARAREAKEAQRARMDGRHTFILETVASRLQIEQSQVEDYILDGQRQLDKFEEFFNASGLRRLLFYCSKCPAEDGEAGKKVIKQLFVTDGTVEAFSGTCVMCIRTTTKALTTANIGAEINFATLETGDSGTMLTAMEAMLSDIFIPALKDQSSWGQLQSGGQEHVGFMSKLDAFVSTLQGAEKSLKDTVKLSECKDVDLSMFTSPMDFLTAANNPEIIEPLEKCMAKWCKEIEQVLTESEQMRKEADNVGPSVELDHWKQRTAKFNSLLDCINSPSCRAVIGILTATKSKLIKQWRQLDVRITDGANEAKDNVKFLYTLDKYCDPLYNGDPVNMVAAIPGLLNAIRMVNSYSRFYNTPERITALFIKVTNQMITACKNYLTNNGYVKVWDQEHDSLIQKLTACIVLNQEYQRSFHRTKQRLEELPDERPFDFSEMSIFSKFDTFCRRCSRIEDMLVVIHTFLSLTQSRLEGIEPMAARYNLLVSNVKKKTYDILDHRRGEFDTDYDEFKKGFSELENQVQVLMDQQFDKIPSTQRALARIKKYELLGISGLDVKEKYHRTIAHYMNDIETVQRIYMAFKDNPPVERNLPPMAGKIAWSQQLLRRIQEPMDAFRSSTPELLAQTPDLKRVVKKYNKTARVLLEFEVVYHQAWLRQVEACKIGLQASLLVLHGETKMLFVNFDPLILSLFREAECMARMSLEVPKGVNTICTRRLTFKNNYDRLKALLDEKQRICDKIPEILQALMEPHINKVNDALQPGLSSLNWMSLNIDLFISNGTDSLHVLEKLIDRATDILNYRIYALFQEMQEIPLCELPSAEPLTIEQFAQSTEELCEAGAILLDTKSHFVEDAVLELRNLFLKDQGEGEDGGGSLQNEDTSSAPSAASLSRRKLPPGGATLERQKELREHLDEEAAELVYSLQQQNVDTLLKLTRFTLDSIKRRVAMSSRYSSENSWDNGGQNGSKSKPQGACFRADIVLAMPSIMMQPSLDEVQQGLNKTAQTILNTFKGVVQWGQRQAKLKIGGKKSKKKAQASDQSIARSGVLGEKSQVKIILPEEEDGAGEQSQLVKSTVSFGDGKSMMKNYFRNVADNKDVQKMISSLSTAINSTKQDIDLALEKYNIYQDIWKKNRDETIKEFNEAVPEPLLGDFKAEIIGYENLMAEIGEIADSSEVGAIALYCSPVKHALVAECHAWKQLFGKSVNEKFRAVMEKTFDFIEDCGKRLGRNIKDLDDIRTAMGALKDLREQEIGIDMSLSPVEESYAMLSKHDIAVAREEAERVDTLRYNWEKLNASAITVSDHLVSIQTEYRTDLLEKVTVFATDTTSFYDDYGTSGPMVDGIEPQEASERLQVYQVRFDELWRKFNTYSDGEALFGLEVTAYTDLQRIRKELNLLQKLYSLYNTVNDTIDGYYDILWLEVDIEKINSDLLDFQNRCRKLPKALKDWQAFNDLKQKIDDFNETCPLLEMMANKAMKERHWERIANTTKHPFDVESENFQLRNIMEAPLLKCKEDIEDICIAAVKEKDIEAKMKQVVLDWSTQELAFGNFKNRGELLLKGDVMAEAITLMEDSLMVLSSLMSNRYNAPFKKDIQAWVQKLSNSTDIIENWLQVQNLWVYLEAVFVGGDIAKQLPKEAKRFQGIDKSWVKIMTRAHENLNIIVCCTGDETMGQLLPHLLEQLELCQKSLTGYLEKKRLIFPRFFFVSDPVLLEILGQASDSHTIQAHLLSVFDNVKTVDFHEKEYDRITAINSREPETIQLEKTVMAQGNVEIWLGQLLDISKASVHSVIRQASHAINDPSYEMMEFLENFPAQVGILGIQFLWTRDAQFALTNARADKKIMAATNQAFLEMLNRLIDKTLQNLTKIQRVKYETLITIHVHQRDIFDDIVKMHVKTPSDFEWLKQTRFYFNDDTDKTLISITDVNFEYQNEFLGCTDRLVITPLTDRCYITLAQALGMALGGAPAGPAGTGKTETTKDMGKALGKYVVVFNCSDQMDFRGLGRIYKGLAQSGSWGCFDEFNRIELPVLSVAAQQIAIVLQCKKERKSHFIFTDGDVVSLSPEFGLFLTMNPGYAGRQELPENLKINFRTVAMMVPDRQIIIRVKLASAGFLENINLSRKFYTLYKLCEEQLSKQVHYDFGLRNILSVLRTLGTVKRKNPTDSESTTVMRVLRDMNLSKLVDEDEPLFLSLINDLFPGIVLDKAGYPDLEGAIAENVEKAGLVNHPPWVLKLIQLFETQRVRHGMMALGPSGAGKTKCIHMLMKAMTDCGEPHREMRMNPKAITAPQMFGRLDVATNDWTDGIFSTLWRRTHKAKKGEHIWLVLDGPVDAIWIENLNSVLDDNKTLTLANGDRIPMAPWCKIVFEPHNIDNASPATVSRNGMVFMSSSALDWRPILDGWLMTRQSSEAEVIRELFHASFQEVYNYSSTMLFPKMEILECNYISQAVKMLEGSLPKKEKEDMSMPDKAVLERYYIFGVMWSIGALLELGDRSKMETFLKEKTKLNLPKIEPGSGNTIFEFVVNNETGEWQHWMDRVPEYNYPHDEVPEYSSILVPNVDNVRTDYIIQCISKQDLGVLLIGEQGTAKTVIIKGFMGKSNPEEHLSKSFNFSSASTPNMFQRTIESYVDKRVGSTYGPPAGKKMTVFVDDINMPIINEWGDQITNEIVRQTIEMQGFYSLEKPGDFTSIVDIQFLAAMIHPGGGRNDIPSRLKRQFSVINCTLPSDASIDKIFGSISEGYFCKERGFKADVVDLAHRLVQTTRQLWQATKVKMLPTPAKFHYIFNLRDLSRIWEGILTIDSDILKERQLLMSLWKHECQRVISDRFTNPQDKEWFNKAITRVATEDLDNEIASLIPEEPYFVDFLQDPPEATGEEPEDQELEAPKIYEPIPPYDELEERLTMFMTQYNETIRGAGMDLVFFKDAMVHLIKISRVIRTSKGHSLLVGVGGSGKQSLTRLASFIANYKIFQITLTRSYNISNLQDDLKVLYRTAGHQGKGITFIFTDQEIKDEAFLEYLNNVLASGEVANLFARDEQDEILNELIPIMKKEFPRRPPTLENLYDYFLYRCRQNLHVVLCFSPVGEKFRNRALKFPALISGCTMDWFSRWPKEALQAVARHFLASYDIVCTPEVKKEVVFAMGVFQDRVAEACVDYFHRYRRTAHVTPKSYLSFINGYKTIYSQKHNDIGMLAKRMKTGLDKLIEASESVAQLSKELAVKEKDLAVASVKAEKVLVEVTASAQAAEKVKAEVQKVKDKAQAIVDAIATDKAVAEGKLEAARPALEEAEAALQTIKPAHISTVRKLANPPHLIMRIMDCVLILFQRKLSTWTMDKEKPTNSPSWSESLKLMSAGGFLNTLQTFPKDTINAETVELLRPYFAMDDYNLASAKKVCGDVAGLCSWTLAMAAFFEINREVLPLKANLVKAEAKLAVAQGELNAAQAQLDEKEAELAAVQAMYDKAMTEKQTLIDDADTCRRKMAAASALIGGLSGEKDRWTIQSKEFQDQIGRLVGDVLLCTGFLSYSGPFNQEFRDLLLDDWKKELKTRGIPFTGSLDVTGMLVDSATVGEWGLQGLPNDELSVQNGIIVTKATRYPLLMDPQGQGKTWVKNKEAQNEMQLTSLNNKYFRTHLEDCLSLGKPILIEDIGEELDPALDNVLEKNFIKSGSTLKVKVGDKEVDVMKGFMLYITTKLPNPSYTPEISARTSIIDFTVTMKGLGDQLLGLVILKEKRELEAERVALLEDVTSNKRKMQELEDNLLYRLTSTKGSLVDDETLIDVLRTTKSTSEDVKQKLQVAADTEIKITSAREEFRPVATRGSILYFLITNMSMVNCMYQTSLPQFLGLFDNSMERSTKSPVTAKRIAAIVEYLTFEVFRYTSRGLYEEDKFLFTLLLALKIDLNNNKVKHREFSTLIKGGAALDLNAVEPKPAKWILDLTWLNLVELSKLPQFSEILSQIARNDKAWKAWFDVEAPEETPCPDGYEHSLDTFRRLLLVRSWCPDRTAVQARKYITESLGLRFAEGVILDLRDLHAESTPRTPMIGLLSMGSDPTADIENLAKRENLECRAISMGQGQDVHARRLLQQFMGGGGWALLQNCHLGLDFMDELFLLMVDAENIHEDFRLWMTTEVHPKFPISLLQIGLKFTNEPPQGIKAGLKRTYTGISQDQLDISNLPQWKPMLFGLAFLHTTVQERRKFGPLGWNIPYEFNQADFTSTMQFFQNHLDDLDLKKGISWTTVRYMIGEVQYGGRVTDDFDKILLNTFAKVWFSDGMFAPTFKFYKGYTIPTAATCKTVANVMEHVEELPLLDTPEAFGLHPNANITYQTNVATNCMGTMVSIQPKDSGGGGGETRESVVQRLADDMLSKLPPDYLPHEVKACLQRMGHLSPMNIFLRQEIDRMQRVIINVRSTLVDLKLAIDGTIIMSEMLRDALDNMYDARVPTAWKKISWASATLGFWFTELLERDTQFRSWCFDGRPNYFWMTGFFNPQGFLTAMRQEVTRAHKGWALDTVVLSNEVTKMFKDDVKEPPAEGVYVYGLFLDGSAWDRRQGKLIEQTPKVLFTSLPVVHIFAINSTAGKDPRFYHCPLYKKPNRTDLTFITTLQLKTSQSPDHWTLRGVALLCDVK